jgi:hypothetical protein
MLSFVAPMMSIILESLQAGVPISTLRMQTIPADLFGVAAGILLGLNIRTMRNAASSPESMNPNVIHPAP